MVTMMWADVIFLVGLALTLMYCGAVRICVVVAGNMLTALECVLSVKESVC